MMKKMLILMILMICSSFAIAATCGTGSTSGMISYWKLDQANGAVVDSYDGNNGTNNGATRNVTGKVNKAFSFDGTDEYADADVGSSMDFGTGNFTFETWIKFNDFDSSHYFLNKYQDGDNRVQLYYNQASDALGFYGEDGNSQIFHVYKINPSLTSGVWYHIAGVYRGTSGDIYVNGVPYAGYDGYSFSGGDLTNTGDFYIGSSGGLHFFHNGSIDEVAVYDRALSASDILGHYNAGLGGEGYCELSSSGVVPEVSNKTVQIFVVLIVALLIGALFWRKR